jgi:hypothetical protein
LNVPIRVPDLAPLLADAVASSRPELLVELAPSNVPLALLPVRIETRFFPAPDESVELRIRVYPDKIHIDAHDPALSAEEVDWAGRYWHIQWHAGRDEARLRSAWKMLADRFEPHRAAWIARVTAPTNPNDRPADALAPEAPLPVEPRLPDLGDPSTRVRTPVARLLPDRWTATAYQNGLVVGMATGRDIPAELAVGPDLADSLAPTTVDDESPAVDLGMRWMIDFDRAEETGMAIRMPLAGPAEAIDLDVLVVSGVRSLPSDDGASAFADLVDGHHYTDGVGFVRPATPSNNTSQERAGFASADPRQERSYAAEWTSPPVDPEGETNAATLARALGLERERADATLGRIPGAADAEDRAAASMQAALWPVTWGYFLSQMVGVRVGGVTVNDLDWGRAYAAAQVRPGGPLPALRCGRQPYGFLPVTSLGRWASSGDGDGGAGDRAAKLRQALVALRDHVWRPAVADVARVGRSDNPNDDLVDVLLGEAVSASIFVRRLMGPNYLRHLRLFLGEDFDGLELASVLAQLTTRLPSRLGLGVTPLLSGAVYEDATERISTSLVQAPTAEGAAATLAPNYIRELLDLADVDALAGALPGDGTPLLKALLRHALLREHAQAAARLLESPELPVGRLLRDTELVDLGPDQPTPTWSWQRGQQIPGTSPALTVREHLNGLTEHDTDAVRSLGEFRAALEILAETAPSDLERHLVDTLDSASHRLDAWVTSFATARLSDLRAARDTGLAIGGYGWVEHLRPEPGRPVDAPPADEPGPLVAPESDPGFVHAPSLDQASAAALLRNAHLAHGGGADDPYAIQLTSTRVRLAQRLFDGVRQGQPLGALLGYDFERRLHDAGLDEFIDDFRRLAPRPGEQAAAAVEKRLVVDGLVLHSRWKAEPDVVLALPGLGGESDPRRRKLRVALEALDSSLDAAADAVNAESVFQLVRGNLTRGASSFEDIAVGQATPPQLEFMRTPRSGTGLTHRVALVLAADSPPPAGATGWADPASSPRASAEPVLNAWAAHLLGPARAVVARVEEVDASGVVQRTHDVELSRLGLTALDLVSISAGDRAEVIERVLDAATRSSDGFAPAPAGMRLNVDLSRRPGAAASEHVFADVLEVAAAAQRLLGGARPLDGADLQAPHVDPERRLDLPEYEARAVAAEAALEEVHVRLSTLMASEQPPTLGQLRAELARAGSFGVPGTLVARGGADDESVGEASSLRAQVGAVLAETARRLGAAAALRPTDDGAPDNVRRDRILRRFQAVFGPGFVALPRFHCPAGDSVRASLADADSLRGGDLLAAYTWMQRMERVRPGLGRLGSALRAASILAGKELLRLAIVQVPHVPGQRWVGLDVPVGETVRDGCASLVLQGVEGLDLQSPVAGLLIDEWVEIVPSRTETTGLAFQYDPPDASAPQTVLLAVPPVVGEHWRVGTLNEVLIETLDLARLRAVGPSVLGDIAHYLPATYLAFNVEGDAVSTDLNPLTT